MKEKFHRISPPEEYCYIVNFEFPLLKNIFTCLLSVHNTMILHVMSKYVINDLINLFMTCKLIVINLL